MPLNGNPRIRVRIRPLADWGARLPDTTWGSNHLRWVLPDFTLRLTTEMCIRDRWFSQQAAFGPTNKEISDQYPTLVVAAGYAFAIWGLIFLWDVVFGVWQLSPRRGVRGSAVARIRLPAALGFALTALWMPVFSQQVYWLALLVIWSSLACLAVCAVHLSRDPLPEPGQTWFAWLPLSCLLYTSRCV